jgi:bud site selection protein 20
MYTGAGDFPCVECSRYFISPEALAGHTKTKLHRRRLKQLKDEPYSQKEAEAAAGLGRDNRRRDENGRPIEVSADKNVKDILMAPA